MVDRDPFRFPPPNNPFMLQYLTNLEQQTTLAQPTLPTMPVETGQGRTPTPQSASYAYNAHRALEQQLMARLQNMLPPQDCAPLGDEPGLQFDDDHMTLDPNQLAEQFGIEGLTSPEGTTAAPLDVDQERIEELGAELRLRTDGNEINDDDLERITGLSTEERVATLQQLSPEQLAKLGDQLPDQDSEKAGAFLAALASDAEAHPELVQGQFSALLDGIKQDGSEGSDDVLHRMQEQLGGGDVSDEANATRAAETLQHLGPENLEKMSALHSSGNKDEKELGVISRARALASGQSPEAAGISAELTERLANDDVDGELIDKLNNATPEDRMSVLENLSPEERQKLAYHGTDDPDQLGNLMATLVGEAEMDPRAQQIVGELVGGLHEGHEQRDDVLHKMQETLGGGDVEGSDARRQAARALSFLDPATLDAMGSIHTGGNKDDKELDVIELAKELQQGEYIA